MIIILYYFEFIKYLRTINFIYWPFLTKMSTYLINLMILTRLILKLFIVIMSVNIFEDYKIILNFAIIKVGLL